MQTSFLKKVDLEDKSKRNERLAMLNHLGKTHIKKCFFFSGLTTKGVGRVNPLSKKTLFFLKPRWLDPKFVKKNKKISKSVSGYFKTKKKKKWQGPIGVGRVKPYWSDH